MPKERTAAALATRLTALLTNSDHYNTQWELVSVNPTTYGHEVVLLDPDEKCEYVIAISKRSKAPAIQATIIDSDNMHRDVF